MAPRVVPVPERLMDCGLPEALSATMMDAVRLPLAVGVNVTVIAQLAPAATELGQLLVWAKSPAFDPPMETLEIARAALPELLRVTSWAALVVPTDWLP